MRQGFLLFNQKHYLITPTRLISFAFVLIWILRFFTDICEIMLYIKRVNVTSSFPVWISFLFLASFLGLGLQVSRWIEVERVTHYYLIPDPIWKISTSHYWVLWYLWAFRIWPLVCWDNLYLFLVCGVVLLWKDIGFGLMSLLYQLIWSHEFYSSFCYCVFAWIYLHIFNQPCL